MDTPTLHTRTRALMTHALALRRRRSAGYESLYQDTMGFLQRLLDEGGHDEVAS